MAKDMVVRRKHLFRRYKAINGLKVELAHIKDQGRVARAGTVTFNDDNTGESRILKRNKKDY